MPMGTARARASVCDSACGTPSLSNSTPRVATSDFKDGPQATMAGKQERKNMPERSPSAHTARYNTVDAPVAERYTQRT